jgi:hypothetical protein
MFTYDLPRSAVNGGPRPVLELLEVVPPSVDEITKAADSAEEPRFVLRLSRPLSPDERRVVALELPNATLHADDDPRLTLSVAPDHLIRRPEAIQTIVQGISTVAGTMRQAEANLFTECASAAAAVNELLALA